MQGTPKSETTNPAVLRYRGLDLDAVTAIQMRNIDALRRMSNLLCDSFGAMTTRQAQFLETHMEQMNAALESNDASVEPKALIERQTQLYREMFDALTAHVGGCAEIVCKCGADLIQEATASLADLPGTESSGGKSASTAAASPDGNAATK